jgi:toxin HigB-1
MEVNFDNKEVLNLYIGLPSKKSRLPKNIIDKFFQAIAVLEAATRIEDVWVFKSYRFKKLEGSDNRFSMRLNDQWRLEMRIIFDDETLTSGIIFIEEISNHYK